jgi:hypothetical protein
MEECSVSTYGIIIIIIFIIIIGLQMGCQASGSIYNMAQQITYTNTHNNNK